MLDLDSLLSGAEVSTVVQLVCASMSRSKIYTCRKLAQVKVKVTLNRPSLILNKWVTISIVYMEGLCDPTIHDYEILNM